MDDKPIRVLIVDDHKMVRRGLRAFLLSFEDFELVGEAGDGQEACTHCQLLQPDVVLMDLVMPQMDGVVATQTIRTHCPQTQIIALTSFPEEAMVQDAIRAGAISYLLKDVDADELARAIREAYRGRSTLAPEAAQALIHATTRPPLPGHDLTAREREVLDLMVDGCSNREIAQQLIISDSTVKFHVSNILSKLGVDSRTEAVSMALQQKLVE